MVEPELVDFEKNSKLSSLKWYKRQVNDNKISKDKHRQAFADIIRFLLNKHWQNK
ncbi:hypothetical protein [Lactococcus lactis]|uniref:hypothetical protein n=1 Tax=Lactococcus lactis TaxID=1358 RepID=UPI0024A857FF|nr:hypothetical protein [Lactococcus lactis]